MEPNQGQEQTESAFNQRSDNAALALKGQVSRQLSAMTGERVELPSVRVPVNEQGQPVGHEQLPPTGSYARQAMELQRSARAQQEALQQHQQATMPPAVQPEAPIESPPREPQEQTSQRTQERIAQLVSQLRQKDQEMQQLQAAQAQSNEELRAQLQAAELQLQQVMEQNLQNLDPETRLQVLSDARIRQQVSLSEQRILQALQPQLAALQTNNDQQERVRLSGIYPGYDPGVHDEMIDEFRRRNRSCSIEQAFRAVATPEELRRGGRPANAPPPVVAPSVGSHTPRYMPQQSSQPDPVEQMRADAQQAAELSRSLSPEDQKRAQGLWFKNLSERLGLSPGR